MTDYSTQPPALSGAGYRNHAAQHKGNMKPEIKEHLRKLSLCCGSIAWPHFEAIRNDLQRLDPDPSPLQQSRDREADIAAGLRELAAANGITWREPLQIDANGEFSLAVAHPDKESEWLSACGKVGEVVGALLAKAGYRCGNVVIHSENPDLGWCRINHFAADKMVNDWRRK